MAMSTFSIIMFVMIVTSTKQVIMAAGMITSGGINRDTLAADIRELRQLMTDGILSKEELKEQVKALIASNKEKQAPNYQHQHVVVNNNNNPAATAALESKKNYRNGRSPDTLMIRNIIAGPICRRLLAEARDSRQTELTRDSRLKGGRLPP